MTKAVPGLFIPGENDTTVTPQSVNTAFLAWRSQGALTGCALDWKGAHSATGPPAGLGDVMEFLFLDEALKLRYPAAQQPGLNPGETVALTPLAFSSGWLAETMTTTSFNAFLNCAPVASYTGSVASASWLPGEAAARHFRAMGSRETSLQNSLPFQNPLHIIRPAALEIVRTGATAPFAVDLRGLGGITKVEFFDGAAKLGELTAAPWVWPLPAGLAPGFHGLTVVSTGAGGAQRSTLMTFLVEQPQMLRITGNGEAILDGDTTPTYADHTYFHPSGGNAARTYTLRNTSTNTVTFTGKPRVTKSGAQNADFTLTQPAVGSLAPGGSATFSVSFASGGAGSRNATLSLVSTDPVNSAPTPLPSAVSPRRCPMPRSCSASTRRAAPSSPATAATPSPATSPRPACGVPRADASVAG